MELKKTCLHDRHLSLGAKMTEFGGFDMPVSYRGILQEHQAVRETCGVFDCSHMGEIDLKGQDALRYLNEITTNDFTDLKDNQLQYTLLCEPTGGVIDDLMVYRFHAEHYLLVVNASNTLKDFKWLQSQLSGYDITLNNVSEFYGQLAVQGPQAVTILKSWIPSIETLSFMQFSVFEWAGHELIISRSGYTGEDGFEIYGSPKATVALWDQLIQVGVEPCGLGARDTLRFEAGLPLYGHEINGFITPLEAGLSFGVKLNKPFIGRDVLLKQKEQGLERRLIGLQLLERNIARDGYIVYDDQKNMVGYITTGYMIPNTTLSVANVMLDSRIKIGTEVWVEIRNKMVKAVIRNRKFYEKKYKKEV